MSESFFERLEKIMPMLELWSEFKYDGKSIVAGTVYNHYKIADETCIRTSRVQKIVLTDEGYKILTTQNSMYLLGQEDSSIENRQLILNKHPLFFVKRGINA